MKLNKATLNLIAELEYLIGSNCYNPKSYDGYSGTEGAHFRYPVTYTRNFDQKDSKTRCKLNGYGSLEKLSPSFCKSLRYKMGANELHIGLGLIQALEYLENRYGIDFSELEKKLVESSTPDNE